jgi:hypothetical protein
MKNTHPVLAIALLATACAAPVTPPSSYTAISTTVPKRTAVHEYRKNYQLGLTQTASVGDIVVAVKDYYVTTEDAGKVVTPSNNFIVFWSGDLTNAVPLVTGAGGSTIPVVAEATLDGKRYYVIEGPSRVIAGMVTGVYIGEDGTIRTDRRRGRNTKAPADSPAHDGQEVGLGLKIVPPNTTFAYSEVKHTEVEAKGYVNYDIIFTGKAGDQLNFVYREYSRDDMARQAFFQNLTYAASEPTIRFRNLRLRIDRVNNEGITYAVVGD